MQVPADTPNETTVPIQSVNGGCVCCHGLNEEKILNSVKVHHRNCNKIKIKTFRHPCQNQRTGCLESWFCPIIIPKRFMLIPEQWEKWRSFSCPWVASTYCENEWKLYLKKKKQSSFSVTFVCVVCKVQEGVIRPPWCRGVWVCRAGRPCWAGRTLPGGSGLWTW